MKVFFNTILAALALSATGAAAPITLTFNLQGTGASASLLTFAANENASFTIDVTSLSDANPALVTRRGTDGVGVDGGTFLDQQDLDGLNGTEALVFTPNFAFLSAQVLSISFTNLDTLFDDDEALIAFDGTTRFNGVLSPTVSSFSSNIFANNIHIQSTDLNDNFSVREVRLQVEPVPEPGTISLLAAGLLSLIYAGRRRRSAGSAPQP